MHLTAYFALLVAVLSVVEADDFSYAVLLPKFVRPGIPTTFVAENFYDESVFFEATLSSKDFKSTVGELVDIGESKTIAFDKVPLDYEGSTDFKVTVTGTDSVTRREIFSDETEKGEMQFEKKVISIFIQTDKAIYQPSQTIKFRAVVTDSDLLPYNGKATYKLIDPNNNVIIQEEDALLVSGVVGSEFKLGRYSTQGEWKIEYQVHGYKESLSVTVEEYKLPKFKVEIKPDKTYLHPGSLALTGVFTATYTFGQPVKGTARLEITTTRRVRSNQPHVILRKFPKFDGSEDFKIEARDIEKYLEWNPKSSYYDLKVTAFVKDKNSQDEFNETIIIELKKTKLKVEAVAKPDNIKPGLPYTAYLKVSEQDGTLLSESYRRRLDMRVEIEYRYPYKGWNFWAPRPPARTISKDVTVGDDGIAVLEILADLDDFESLQFNVKIDSHPDANQYWENWSPERFESPSNTYIQVSTDDTSLSAGDVASLTIRTTEKADMYWVAILARGKLIKKDMVEPLTHEKGKLNYVFYYKFSVTAEMSPNVYFIVSFIRPDGEIVADSIKINVQASLKNKVKITTSTDETDAGKPVKITVQAAGNSFVGLRAIDQSVLLLKEGNDITQDKIFADLDKYGTSSNTRYIGWGGGYARWWWPYPIGGADVSEVFENSGVIMLTDALVYRGKSKYLPPPNSKFLDLAGLRSILPAMGLSLSEPPTQNDAPSTPEAKVRNLFPETWIWAEEDAGSDGLVTFNYNTPDTITTWELSSFAVSDTKGLGVTRQNSKITVFRNFFISLNLPPTMIRGEILNMRTTLFNYFDEELTVTLTLKDSEWYDLIIIGGDPVAAGPKRTVYIPSKDSITVVFPIKFKKAGLARVSVKATSSRAGDAVDRTLVVKPEGIPKTVSHSTIIERQSGDPDKTIVTFDVDIPEDAVQGSPYVKFSVSGNILGNALSNLGSLLRMPSGCGEQTMLSFAPDVYISLYLKGVDELIGKLKQKSKEHIQQGYQNELRYQHKDGSFSAFGSSDHSGSTWLTAFVVKCFISATQLDSNLIEKSKIQSATNFIIGEQNRDGTFKEPGRVIHKSMQGGVNSKQTTAAYMLIALAEGGYFKKDQAVLRAMDKTVEYLERQIGSVHDTYTLAIMSYALALVDSREAANVLKALDQKATTSGNLRYWEQEEKGMSHCKERKDYCPISNDKASSSSIEITAYALLTYVQMGRGKSVMPIVRWLVEQRSAFGGYHSTQDTVMAIQALSTVAALFSDRATKLDITVTHDGDDDFSENFRVNASNAIILQMTDLPAVDGTVTVSATGHGFADVQLTVSYNLPVGPRSDEPFDLKVDLKDNKREKSVMLVVCSKINMKRKEIIDGTGMFVISVTLPSGYTIDDKQATKDNKQLKLVELDGDEVTGYFDELPRGRTICMDLKLQRYAEVTGVKAQIIKAFDYYEPGRMAMRTYQPGNEEDAEEAGICALCGDDCVGCPDGPKGPIGPKPPCGDCFEICPDFADGLHYNPAFGASDDHPSYPNCSAPNGAGGSEGYGLPATKLDQGDHYIDCPDTIFGQALKGRGFTISLAIYPVELVARKRSTIFSIGSGTGPGGEVYVLFEKKIRSDMYWLKVRLNGAEYTVRPIRTSDIPLNVWSVVTIQYSEDRGPKVFIDGVVKGRIQRKRSPGMRSIKRRVTMQIGKSHVSKGDDAFHGLVSNLDVWTSTLSSSDILSHYDCLAPLLTQSNSG